MPQGAGSPSLAVLENDGRKREEAIDSEARWVRGQREMDDRREQAEIVEVSLQTKRAHRRWQYTHGQQALAGSAVSVAAPPEIGRGAGSLLAARRGASRFQNGSCGSEDTGRALVGNFLFGFQPVLNVATAELRAFKAQRFAAN